MTGERDMLPKARRDTQSMTAEWERVGQRIDGVLLKRTRHIVTGNGITTELYRSDWTETGVPVGHTILVALDAGRVSAWHAHETQTDGFFVVVGRLLLVLFDDRPQSPTRGRTMTLRLDAADPQLVLVPARVWHGVKPLGGPASFINLITHPYRYDDPDEWRLPRDTDQIPFDILSAE